MASNYFGYFNGERDNREFLVSRTVSDPEFGSREEILFILSVRVFREDRSLEGYLVVEGRMRSEPMEDRLNIMEPLLLDSRGVLLSDRDGLPLTDGGRKIPFLDEIKEERGDDETLLFSGSFYRNRNNEIVLGAGVKISELDLIYLMEIPFSRFSRPYFTTFSVIIVTLALSLIFFILIMNRLDLSRLYALDANPLTHLPGNNRINREVQRLIDSHEDMTVIYGDLDNFKAFNDLYGFSRGDDVIAYTAEIFRNARSRYRDSFCGHIGGDDFIFIVSEDKADEAAESILEDFDRGIRGFYSEIDRQRGYITSLTRTGEEKRFPLISISLAGVRLTRFPFSHYLEVSGKCAELKKLAKEREGSVFVRDRRNPA